MVKLFDHQKTALGYLKTNKSFAIFLDQGMGKTLIMMYHMLYLLRSGKIETFLVVAPKAVLGAWERDLEMFDPEDQKILSSGMTIINYDKVWRNKDKSPYYHEWGAIILDEAHAIKNRGSERSKFLLKLSLKCEYRYILTGTPIGNGHLENIWSEYCFLAPHKEKRSISSEWLGTYYEFCDRYCDLNQYYQPYRYRNVNQLQDIINEHSYRAVKSECMDLPEKLPDEIWSCEMGTDLKKYYKRLATESAIINLDLLCENPLTRMLKLRQMCSGYIQTDDDLISVPHDKLRILGEYLDENNDKLVIFAQFRRSIKDICDLLKKKTITYVVLDGDQEDKSIWRQFQKDDQIKVIVVQYESGSAGIDLYASSTMIFYEPTIRSNTLEQARDRIHRTGQHHPCTYIHLITKGSIEEQIYKSLTNYSDFSKELFEKYLKTYTRSYAR